MIQFDSISRTFQILGIGIFLLSFGHDAKGQEHKSTIGSTRDPVYSVSKLVDGDTFWVDNDTEEGMKIRLIGMNTPEHQNRWKKKEEPFGKEAKHYVDSLIWGTSVRLEFDVDSLDRYGRTLAYVYLEDGTFLNAHLIEVGMAMVMTVPPNVKYVDLFVEKQKTARRDKRGLWGIPITE